MGGARTDSGVKLIDRNPYGAFKIELAWSSNAAGALPSLKGDAESHIGDVRFNHISKHDFNMVLQHGASPFWLAAQSGDVALARQLASAGADVDAVDSYVESKGSYLRLSLFKTRSAM